MTETIDVPIEEGTGNVFADLGFGDPDTHLLKAQLVSRMAAVMDERKLTQVAAARAVGASQPDMSRILRGQFRDVSVERLMRMLDRLGYEIDIVLRRRNEVAPASIIPFRGLPAS